MRRRQHTLREETKRARGGCGWAPVLRARCDEVAAFDVHSTGMACWREACGRGTIARGEFGQQFDEKLFLRVVDSPAVADRGKRATILKQQW